MAIQFSVEVRNAALDARVFARPRPYSFPPVGGAST
jgi:hypothetical protein